jgi:hypothetical protein
MRPPTLPVPAGILFKLVLPCMYMSEISESHFCSHPAFKQNVAWRAAKPRSGRPSWVENGFEPIGIY